MKGKSGREMRALVVAVSVSVLALMLAVIAYFMVDIILTTNRNIERNQQLVVEQSALALSEIGENISGMTADTRMIGMFNQELINDILSSDWETFYTFIGDFGINFYPIDYIGVMRDGEVVSFKTTRGFNIDATELPTQPASGDYETLDRLGDQDGFFISAFYPIDLSMVGLDDFYVNMIVDRTDELATVRDYFEGQRNDLILRLSIAAVIAIILSLLLTTIGLRYFTRKYVVKPIEELNHTAEEIADGTFTGDVQVDPGSAYAALQGLLRSGQKVLRRMDEEIRE
jgi:HAMP domain-containing protein